jgi:NADPH-dependent glutamate synthase beta subunit-like oxidoreductase
VDDDGQFISADKPISIRALKRFVCEQFGPEARDAGELLGDIGNFVPPIAGNVEEMAALLRANFHGSAPAANGQRVAIIGAGPAGLSAAHDLALLGIKSVVFESEPAPAGMLYVGVPAYRLPREVIEKEIGVIRALGAEIRCGVTVGKDITFAELRREFAAVIIAVGAKASRLLGLPGERGPGVLGGVDLLRAVALGETVEAGREVVVIGGGNVAYDVARTVLRQIASDTARTAARLPGTSMVKLVSLEGLEEMPADTVEIVEGDEEGVERLNGWGPVEIVRDAAGNVEGVTFQRCRRVYDENRRFSPVFDDSERITLACDTVLMAVGQSPVVKFLEDGGEDVEQFRPGWPKADPKTLATTAPGVFVAGDLAHGTRLLIDAVASGKAAARSVFLHLTGKRLEAQATTVHLVQDRYRREKGYESIRRVAVPISHPEERLHRPDALVEIGYNRDEAMREASRCLDCGVTPVFDGSRCVLCGGCADVCPTLCLKLVSLSELADSAEIRSATGAALGESEDLYSHSAILKDEDRCIRCAACAMRCPVDAISMERVCYSTQWRME